MITIFYFDLELFEDTTLREQALANGALLDSWRDYGCLVSGGLTAESVKASVKSVPPKYYQKWLNAFSFYKQTKSDPATENLSGFDNFDCLKAEFVPLGVKTALISSDYIALYDNLNCSVTGFELVSPSNFNESINFQRSNEFAVKDIEQKEAIQDIWNSRFHNLACYSKVVTIIDRFSVINLLADHRDGLKTSIEHLFELLAKTNRKFSIKLYGACDIGGKATNITELKTYLNSVLRKKPCYAKCISSFDISLCKNNFFGKEAHDRMLRFDDHIIQIGNGLDVFRDSPVLYNTFNIKRPDSTNFKGIHKALQSNIEPGCANL